ncbi:MAG: AAA family ATPase, partial [Anaerolineae bacterium]
QRQRLLLAIALVNDPELVFLDEPTTGLDPQSRRNFWQLISRIRDEGKTIILTTHYMEEASVLCDHIAVIDHGRIIEEGAPAALLATHFPPALIRLPRLAFGGTIPAGFERQGERLQCATRDIHASLEELRRLGVDLGELEIGAPTLEDLFLKLTGQQLRA